MARKSAENQRASFVPKNRRRNRKYRAGNLCAALLAACLLTGAVSYGVQAAGTSAWSEIPETTEDTEAQVLPESGQNPQTEDGQETVSSLSGAAQETAIAREKRYLLEALDELQEMGLSPILIWSEITKDERVLNTLDEMKDTVTGTVTQKVSEAGAAATKAVGDAVQNEAEKAKRNLLQMSREQIQNAVNGFFENHNL